MWHDIHTKFHEEFTGGKTVFMFGLKNLRKRSGGINDRRNL
jgi:hypothetical protein